MARSVDVYSGAGPGVRMALKIDTLQMQRWRGGARRRRLRRAGPVRVILGSPLRMTLPAVRSSAGDWGMSVRGSGV